MYRGFSGFYHIIAYELSEKEEVSKVVRNGSNIPLFILHPHPFHAQLHSPPLLIHTNYAYLHYLPDGNHAQRVSDVAIGKF